MENSKHYPTHPGAEHPPIMTCEIPLEEYESLKRENERLNRELEHVKNGDCIYTCDVVEKHVKEELKAKRALWMALGAVHKAKAQHEKFLIRSHPQWEGTPAGLKTYKQIAKYENYERKCRAKAEEYR